MRTLLGVAALAALAAWYEAFDVQPGDKLYIKPEDRVRIW
jgi:putative endopeptidase